MFSPPYGYTANNNGSSNGNHMKMVATSHTLNTYPTNGHINSGNNLNNIQVNNNNFNNTSNGNTNGNNNSNGLSKNTANINNIKSAKMLIRPKDLPGYKN